SPAMAGNGRSAGAGGVAIFCAGVGAGAGSARAGGGGSATAVAVVVSAEREGVLGAVSWFVSFVRLLDLTRFVACAPLCDLCFEASATLGTANNRLADTVSIVFIMPSTSRWIVRPAARERCEKSSVQDKYQERSSHLSVDRGLVTSSDPRCTIVLLAAFAKEHEREENHQRRKSDVGTCCRFAGAAWSPFKLQAVAVVDRAYHAA